MTDEAKKVLRRSRRNHVVAGVCGGLEEFFGISAFWFRLAFLIALLPGGEVSLLNAMAVLEKMKVEDEDEQVGINIVRKALEAPLRKLAGNAGQDGSVIIDGVRRKAKEDKNKNIGYNVLTGEYVDMIKAGVIDPVKVVRGALENATSIAAMILTTDALVTDVPEKDKAPAMPPGGGMGGDF